MEERVLLLRVLHDGVVVRVLRTNAVLQCTVSPATHTLRQGEQATVRVAAYEAPFVCVTLADTPRAAEPPVTCLHAELGCERRTRRHFSPLQT